MRRWFALASFFKLPRWEPSVTSVRRLSLVVAVVGLLAIVVFLTNRAAGGPDPSTANPTSAPTNSVDGDGSRSPQDVTDRVQASGLAEAAILLSQDRWDQADTVVLLATEDGRAGVAGAGLAAALGAPILLDDASDDRPVLDEIRRLGADRVVIIASDATQAAQVDVLFDGIDTHTIVPGDVGVDLVAAAWLQQELGGSVDLVVVADQDTAMVILGAVTRRSASGTPTVIVVPAGPASLDGVATAGQTLVVRKTGQEPAALEAIDGDRLVGDDLDLEPQLEARWSLTPDAVLVATPATQLLQSLVAVSAARVGERVVALDGLSDEAGLRRLRAAVTPGMMIRMVTAGVELDEAVTSYAAVLSGSAQGLLEPLGSDRLGLHVTSSELATWRERAVSGPFRSAGDVAPGRWV